jgi:hypothetical protein
MSDGALPWIPFSSAEFTPDFDPGLRSGMTRTEWPEPRRPGHFSQTYRRTLPRRLCMSESAASWVFVPARNAFMLVRTISDTSL